MSSESVLRHWYALYVRARHEFKAEEQVKLQGINAYLPVITRTKQWSDRKKKVTEPILGGYLFIYASEHERLIALEQPSVVRCVCEFGRPAKIPENQIENLRAFVRDQRQYTVRPELVKGVKVRITTGPLEGVEGIVLEEPDGKTLAVSIEMLNRTIITHLSGDELVEIVTTESESTISSC